MGKPVTVVPGFGVILCQACFVLRGRAEEPSPIGQSCAFLVKQSTALTAVPAVSPFLALRGIKS